MQIAHLSQKPCCQRSSRGVAGSDVKIIKLVNLVSQVRVLASGSLAFFFFSCLKLGFCPISLSCIRSQLPQPPSHPYPLPVTTSPPPPPPIPPSITGTTKRSHHCAPLYRTKSDGGLQLQVHFHLPPPRLPLPLPSPPPSSFPHRHFAGTSIPAKADRFGDNTSPKPVMSSIIRIVLAVFSSSQRQLYLYKHPWNPVSHRSEAADELKRY